MASAADLQSLEESCPWLAEDWRAELDLLAGGTASACRMNAADLRVIARLAARVPRCPFDEVGSTPWTSFRTEVALARKVTDRAAAQVIRCALRLTTVLPCAMALLETGVLTIPRAVALVTELETVSDEIAGQVDAEIAHVLALLPVWRIEQEVRKAVLRLDPEAVAERVAAKNVDRGVTLYPDTDDQALVALTGPAVPLTRWYATLDTRARALKAGGDPRSLDALRFDLATSTFPCDTHAPADPTTPVDNTPDPASEIAAAPPAPTAPGVDNTPDPASGIVEDSDTEDADTEDADTEDADTEDADTEDADTEGAGATLTPAGPGVDNTPDPAGEIGDVPDDDVTSDVPVGDLAPAAAGLRPSFVEAASTDCRQTRPVRANVHVPVETALGLSNEPAWLDSYGWISAPTCRLLLIDAELRQVCVQTGTGQLVDLPTGIVRPPPTPTGLRGSLLDMVLNDVELSDIGWRSEPQHDPSDRLRDFITLRDRTCDGPTGARVPASRAELDHDDPWPAGPTAAWNLAARGRRTHQHKHHGWTPVRTETSTLWFSPSGQLIEMPRHLFPPPGTDPDPDQARPVLPDPDELAHLDRTQLTPPTDDTPVLPATERDRTRWTWLDGSDPAPF